MSVVTWFLEHPHADHYTDAEGRRWPRVSTVVAEWQRCAMPSNIPERVLREAANLGTVVHAGIAALFGAQIDFAALPVVSARSALRATHAMIGFRAFCDEHSPTALHVERRMACTTDRVVGTADFIGTLSSRDGIGVVDWKTSETLHRGGRVALAKYADMAKQGGLDVRWAALVRLCKNTDEAPGYEMRTFSLDDLAADLEAFRHLRALHGIAQTNNIKEAA